MYTKTSWVARVGTALNRFLKSNESSGSVELTNDPTGVTTEGTPFTVANMNKIEDGIYASHYPTFTEAATLENIASGEVQETLWGKVKKAIARVIIHDGWLDQDLKTTASPTFNTINLIRYPFIFRITQDILSSFASPATAPYGLTFDGTNLISCDYASDRIYIHDGVSNTILSSFASPATSPSGLTFDGTNLISCDMDTDRIYIHDGISSTILSSFASPSTQLSGITFDGMHLISCDMDTDRIYIHETTIRI